MKKTGTILLMAVVALVAVVAMVRKAGEGPRVAASKISDRVEIRQAIVDAAASIGRLPRGRAEIERFVKGPSRGKAWDVRLVGVEGRSPSNPELTVALYTLFAGTQSYRLKVETRYSQ